MYHIEAGKWHNAMGITDQPADMYKYTTQFENNRKKEELLFDSVFFK
jgi:hypothetical protein